MTLTPISKRGKSLFTPYEPDELRDLRSGLRAALAVPSGDTPPTPVNDWRTDWSRLAALELTGLHVPEAAGGAGDRVDAAAVAAAVIGEALHGVPIAGLVAAASALARSASVADPEVASLLGDVLSGARTCVFAPYDDRSRSVHATVGAEAADALVLHDDRSGRTLLVTDRSAWTGSPTSHGEVDVTRTVVRLEVDEAACRDLTAPAHDPLVLYRLLLAADALGCVQRSVERAVGYSATRTAFGTVTGGFQAVQHRLVDHAVQTRGMTLAVTEAARALSAGEPAAGRAVLVAEAAVGMHATQILHDLIQLTGGIGFTWEHGLHLFERRAQTDALLAANPRRALSDLALVEGWAR